MTDPTFDEMLLAQKNEFPLVTKPMPPDLTPTARVEFDLRTKALGLVEKPLAQSRHGLEAQLRELTTVRDGWFNLKNKTRRGLIPLEIAKVCELISDATASIEKTNPTKIVGIKSAAALTPSDRGRIASLEKARANVQAKHDSSSSPTMRTVLAAQIAQLDKEIKTLAEGNVAAAQSTRQEIVSRIAKTHEAKLAPITAPSVATEITEPIEAKPDSPRVAELKRQIAYYDERAQSKLVSSPKAAKQAFDVAAYRREELAAVLREEANPTKPTRTAHQNRQIVTLRKEIDEIKAKLAQPLSEPAVKRYNKLLQVKEAELGRLEAIENN